MNTQRGRAWAAVLVPAISVMLVTPAAVPAQAKFTTLVNFDGTNGSMPAAGLVQGFNGNLYGTTRYGGGTCYVYATCGTVFEVTPAGTLTTLYKFCAQANCADGADPLAGLLQTVDGSFYGTTEFGGTNVDCYGSGCGTVFKISPTGTLATLYSFCAQTNCADGTEPAQSLMQASDGNFYGATPFGGNYNSDCPDGCGTLFKTTPAGQLTTIYTFCAQANCTDGGGPNGGLVQASDGSFYGTTAVGGIHGGVCSGAGCGTVFKITSTGVLTTLYSFCVQTNCTDGFYPYAGLVQGTDGNFYGTTSQGGAHDGGSVFKVTPTGSLTTLYSFCSLEYCADGANVVSGLIQGTDGNLYGTTDSSQSNFGTVFEITPSGTLTTLFRFNASGNEGGGLDAGLIQDTAGAFYSTSSEAGTIGDGTVFSLGTGLGPFIETLPSFGKAGASVRILGSHLTGASAVTFNGVSASFKVVSPSLITTSVPSGATTGTVQVTTPGGTLSSNVPFRVVP